MQTTDITLADWNPAVHDGLITLSNPSRGTHRTFRIETNHSDNPTWSGRRMVALFVGTENDNPAHYRRFGEVQEDGSIHVWRSSQAKLHFVGHPLERYADTLNRPAVWKERGVIYQPSVWCRRCGRTLTTPESIASGIGPICANR